MEGSAPAFLLGIVENGITFVVFGTVAFSLIMSVLFLVTKGSDSLYDQIGQGGISREDDAPGAGGQQLDSAAARAEQEAGDPPDARRPQRAAAAPGRAGTSTWTPKWPACWPVAPQAKNHDATLEEEVRQLVIARNERRQRQGLEELDVDSEVARTLEELDP